MTETDESAAAVTLEGVSKRFERTTGSTVEAVADISLQVDAGELVTVVGPSGCGKTTLIRLIGGLDSPTTGQITVGGRPVTDPGPDRAMVFQEYHLFPWLTVRENVAFGVQERGVPVREREQRVDEMLELVQLPGSADAYPAELSGGMKQRVGLARALAVDPSVLLMDEPFGSVDARTRRHLQRELLALWEDIGTTILFVTHDVTEALFLGDRVVVLGGSPGRVTNRIEVDLDRPRDRTDPRFTERAEDVIDLVGRHEHEAV